MITLKEVEQLGKLSRIALSQEELRALQKDLAGILAYIEKLQEVPLDNVTPVSHITGLEDKGRDDEARAAFCLPEELVAALAAKKGKWMEVPLIITKT